MNRNDIVRTSKDTHAACRRSVRIVDILLFFELALEQTLVIVSFIDSFCLFVLGFIELDVAKLLQGLENVLFAVFHLDRVDDLLNLTEDVVVLCLDPSDYLLPPEKQRICRIIVQHLQFLLVKTGFLRFDDYSKRLVLELGVFVDDRLVNFKSGPDLLF